MVRIRIAFLAVAASLLAGSLCPKGQVPDPNYAPTIANPTYPDGTGLSPLVAVDETHRNYHKISFRYQGFASLLSADGYEVVAFETPFTPGCIDDPEACAYWQALGAIDTLVISNAIDPVSSEEASVIAHWVSLGGSLMLIADHKNYPAHVNELALAVGLDWDNAGVDFTEPFSKSAGTLHATHPVTVGFDASEEIPEVTTFYGSVFDYVGAGPAASILTFPEGVWYGVDGNVVSAAGLSQGMVIEFGWGRVYASGEAAMFTALTNGPGGAPRGMHTTPYNEQFLLNVMHWLDRLL